MWPNSCVADPELDRDAAAGEDRRRQHELIDRGLHAILFTDDSDGTRAFLRDTLGLESVDAGHGWLIFAGPPSELAAHPAEGQPHHELYLMCDDIDATVAELREKGARFSEEIVERPWGRSTTLELPGGGQLPLYEPSHPSPLAS